MSILQKNGEYHRCIFYKNAQNMNSLTWLQKKHEENNDAEGKFIEKPAKLCSNVWLKENKKSQHMHSLTFKKRFSFNSKQERRKIFDSTSKNSQVRNLYDASIMDSTLNAAPREEHSKGNTSLKDAVSVEPHFSSEKDDPEASKKTSISRTSNYEQNESGSTISNLCGGNADDEFGISLEDRKLQSLNKDKDDFMNALIYTNKNAPSGDESSSDKSNFLDDFDALSLNEEPDYDMMETSCNLKDNISSKVPSEVQNNTKESVVNEDESVCHLKQNNGVGGTRICPSKKMYVCYFCRKLFKYESFFRAHIRTHTAEKPFVCKRCGKSFSDKSNLNIHYRTHW